jgi:methionyl-tRNA formyltransferase
MTKKSATIVFFGNERIATGVTTSAPTLKKLVAAGYHIPVVVVNNEESASRKQRKLEIAEAASGQGIPILAPARLKDIKEKLQAYNADLGVLIAYGKMVPQEIIDLFPRGIVNIHPSLLPLHRGSTPLESVLLAGEEQTGVSVMSLVKEMDAGPVYAQQKATLAGNETKQELADRLLGAGSNLLIEVLPHILDGSLVATPQDDSRATYDSLIMKNDGRIDWQKPAVQLEREVRAYQEWPKSRTVFSGLEVVVSKAHVIEQSGGQPGETAVINKQPVVYCGKDVLALDILKPASKKEMTGEAFLAGYKQLFLG